MKSQWHARSELIKSLEIKSQIEIAVKCHYKHIEKNSEYSLNRNKW